MEHDEVTSHVHGSFIRYRRRCQVRFHRSTHLHPGLATASTASWALWSSARRCSAPNILSNFRSRWALASHAILMTTALNPDPDSDFLRIRSTCQPLPTTAGPARRCHAHKLQSLVL